MQDRVGDDFAGLVTSVTSFGLFVELTDIYIEGLVHITALPADYYHFDAVHHRLTGEGSGRRYGLGDPIRVKVARVDLDDRKIDFEMSAEQPAPLPGRGPVAGKPAGGRGKSATATKPRSKKPKAPAGKSSRPAAAKSDKASAPSGKSKKGKAGRRPAESGTSPAASSRAPRKRKSKE